MSLCTLECCVVDSGSPGIEYDQDFRVYVAVYLKGRKNLTQKATLTASVSSRHSHSHRHRQACDGAICFDATSHYAMVTPQSRRREVWRTVQHTVLLERGSVLGGHPHPVLFLEDRSTFLRSHTMRFHQQIGHIWVRVSHWV